MAHRSDVWKRTLIAAGAGAAFAALEILFEPATRPPLGVSNGMLIGGAATLAAMHGGMAAATARTLGRRAPLVPVVLWAMVWGPELARSAGHPAWLGAVAPVGLLFVGLMRPHAALAIALFGALPWNAPGPALAECGACDDVVLVTVDTVRVDSGLLRHAGISTPEWQVGTAVSAAPWTPPAMHSLFLGAPVEQHGAGVERAENVSGRPGGATGLAEALRTRGYRTAAFASNPHLRPSAGFQNGFSTWAHIDEAPAPLLVLRSGRLALRRWFGRFPTASAGDEAVLRGARAWLRDTDVGARFVWIHLMGPHAWPREDAEGEVSEVTAPAERRARYAGLVESTGGRLQHFWREVPEDALLVVTSDHGEALGEDGRWGHGHALEEVLLEVPFAVRGPRVSRIPSTVRAASIKSAVLSWVDGGSAQFGVGEGTRLGGVRGHPGVFGMWQQGGVAASTAAEPARAPPALLDAQHRSALERLGYLDGTEGPE